MKIDNKKIENIIKKIFKINKVKNFNNLKIGSLKNWDSLGNFNLLLEIEKEFKIKFSNADFTSIKSIKETDGKENSLYHGIANRQCTRKFTLADDIIVKDGKLEDGMLSIELERVIPEEKKPRMITIK